jgi:Protein of unknown function (DUF1592)/Protein of unknown function (DUF1588)/Protein of unknown function (DUF1585)/Protein of unknown function (DUF1587)/Protein of unknown function (DUF1595)
MRWASLSVLVALLAVYALPLRGVNAQQDKAVAGMGLDFSKAIRPLLKTYCQQCHNTTKRRAGLDLEKIETESAALDLYDLWDQVGERLRSKEMPPAKSTQPTDKERQTLLAWVKHVADARVCCDKLTNDQREKSLVGYTQSRRLNRIEYNNTLRDLFGVDVHAGDLLPSEGGGGEGFDNAGATLFTTPPLLEKYLEAAELVLATLFPASAAKNNSADAASLETIRRKLLIAVPGSKLTPGEAARKILDAFLPRAFRRPATASEVERYGGIFDRALQRGDSFDQALKLTLKGVLISPSFLFLIETPSAKTGVYQPGHYEMACYLSYFLWASMPDEELFQLAGQGKLRDDRVLRAQVERMIRDPRARGLADSFAAQWFGIRPLGVTLRPDAAMFPEFDEDLAAAMRAETLMFFDTIIREDRSVLEILDAPYTFVNERLAAFYKIGGVKGPQMQRVRRDDPVRGGVLGQASILTATSFPHRTSPVLRGKFILEELLGADVPPPPPDVPVLNEKKRKKAGLTIRQSLEAHRAKTECAACHQRMDPLGFGLENFDPVGRWRTEHEGKPIDSVGILPSGERFDGPVELKKLLLEKRRTEFLRNLSRKMLGYALGREVNRIDMCSVEDCVRALEQGGFRASRLLETIVTSYPFTHRCRKE